MSDDLVTRLLNLHERMLSAVRKQRPYPVKLHCGNEDTGAILEAAAAIEQHTGLVAENERKVLLATGEAAAMHLKNASRYREALNGICSCYPQNSNAYRIARAALAHPQGEDK